MVSPSSSSSSPRAVRKVRPWLRKLARAGHAAKGVVYLLVGGLAVQAALGFGGETTDPKGAIRNLAGLPGGKVLLPLLAIGLAAYAVWRVLQAALDPDGKGKSAKGIAARIGYAV